MQRTRQINLHEIADEALRERGLRTDFSAEAKRQAAAVELPDFSALKIPDLSALPWSSIDNDDSKDLDQVECATVEGKRTRILVGIADVAAVIPKDSPLDQHARNNTTSVYTGVQTYPMLPPRLSTDLTSLNESEKRLAVVIEAVVSKEGEVESFKVYPAIVQNKAQLTYEAVAAWLEDHQPADSEITQRMLEKIRANPELQAQLKIQDEAAQALRRNRHENGALVFGTQQLRPTIEPDGSIHLAAQKSNRATQLIEEFMVAANQSVLEYLDSKGYPDLERIVREPERWQRMVELAAEHDGDLPAQPDGKALAKFLVSQERKDPDRFPDLSLAMIKLMGRGEYVMKAPGQKGEGHFGLAVPGYGHTTAPNRRFPDLIKQRILHAAFEGKKSPYNRAELQELATRCSMMEQAASKAERQVHKSIAALALQDRIGEKFSGFITGAGEKGVWVRIANPPVEGKVEGLTAGLKVGDQVEVRLLSTNVERGYIDFGVVDFGKRRRR
ncbi:MAG: RNB domain-containing ribonuclease [Oligoflexia bacterium]|nr:RNB domain-containing ribonuclease [Oligoflexia bacterium]